MTNGALLLLNTWLAEDRYVGLLQSAAAEITPSGYARALVEPRKWEVTDWGTGARAVGPAVRFAGFETDAPIVGFFLSDTKTGAILFPVAFDAVRTLLGDDELYVTPTIELEIR